MTREGHLCMVRIFGNPGKEKKLLYLRSPRSARHETSRTLPSLVSKSARKSPIGSLRRCLRNSATVELAVHLRSECENTYNLTQVDLDSEQRCFSENHQSHF